ncbi:methionine aminopeptidase [Alphaproteobacteria bacterium]
MKNKDGVIIHSEEDFASMRKSGRLAAKVLDYVSSFIEPGIATEELNDICHQMIVASNATPAPLNYRRFPKSICTSVNHVVCHGIPSSKRLVDGDIVNIDVTVVIDGWHGDASRMYLVGKNVSIQARRLVQVTFEAMMTGIEVVRPGVSLNEIGRVIQKYAEQAGYSVVRDYCGHGIGRAFHCVPQVLHYYTPQTPLLEEGMFFTIEPMINIGRCETKVLSDGWTVVTRDKSLSAQFEHTVGVTKTGYEIFTLSDHDAKSYG